MNHAHSILVIDDELEMRIALSESLVRSGYYVITAANGYEAIEKFSSHGFEVVITDIRMPKMNGIQVLREIKRKSPQTPVVMVTAYGTIDNAVEAMKIGAFDYILKPFSSDILEDVVKGAVDSASISIKGQKVCNTTKREGDFITQDTKIINLLKTLKMVAQSSATVLIQGESGTGKELMARFIHNNSTRADKPLVAVNCAALPDGLLESELFGYERGAFTGASASKAGKFEMADTGTIMLDEISEMSLPLQAKILRVLQEREVDKVGGKHPIPLDIRVIATTNRLLKREVKEGRFREDLYYRLNVFPVTIPPLKDRIDDIPLLAEHFVNKYQAIAGRSITNISSDGLDILKGKEWRGNVRELQNVIERAVILANGEIIMPHHLFFDDFPEENLSHPIGNSNSLWEREQQLILHTLEETSGNRTHAAKKLGISIRTLRNKLREYREMGVRV
ncbi:MAG: sigma-54-dependent transcriptional regulator [Nitrospirota bacterium]